MSNLSTLGSDPCWLRQARPGHSNNYSQRGGRRGETEERRGEASFVWRARSGGDWGSERGVDDDQITLVQSTVSPLPLWQPVWQYTECWVPLRLQKVWRVCSVVWCGVVWCGVQDYYLQSYTVCRCHYSSHYAMALSVKQDKINLDCWSAMDKIADCAARMLRGTKSTPGFCSQNIEVSWQLHNWADCGACTV